MTANRLTKLAVAAVAVAAPLLTAGSAFASTSAPTTPAGYSVVEGCSSFAGQITYSPGLLTSKLKPETAVVSGTLSNCSNGNGPLAGTGSILGTVSGTASLNSIALSGTLAVTWPGSTNTVSVRLTGANQGVDTVQGSVASGPYTTGLFQTSLLAVAKTGSGTAKKPVVAQSVVNTAPVNVLYNFG